MQNDSSETEKQPSTDNQGEQVGDVKQLLKEKTNGTVSTATNAFLHISKYISRLKEQREQERLVKVEKEVTAPHWGTGELFKRGEKQKTTNISPKKVEKKK